MKPVLVLVMVIAFVAIAEGSVQLPYTKAELEFLANVKFEQLPKDLQIAIRKPVHDGDSRNWCCVNNRPIKSVQKTKTVINNIKVTNKVKVGYKTCTYVMSICPIYDVKYTTKSESHLEYFEAPDLSTCPEPDVRCCEGFVKVADYCAPLTTIQEYGNAILKLNQPISGVVG